jgi:hypothetical protein
VKTLYVVEQLGMKQQDGDAHPLSGMTDPNVPTIILAHEALSDATWTRKLIHHETGHLFDGMLSGAAVSTTARGSDGRLLFGQGRPIEDKTQPVDVSKADWTDSYCSTSPCEDLANTHALVLEMRTAFNQANPGHDLLLESPQLTSAFLSIALGRKAEAVVTRYQQLLRPEPAGNWMLWSPALFTNTAIS